MPSDALAIAPAILAVVLVVSAVGKIRAPRASAEAFRDLKVPAPLRRPGVVTALPWVELLLALALLVVGGSVGTVAAAAALALFTAYLLLVVRALGFAVPVDCACFGEFAPGQLTRWTVLRNAWLVAVSAVSLGRSTNGASVASQVTDGRAPWWWLVAAAAAAVTVSLVTGRRAGVAATEPADRGPLAVEEEDYLRVRTPALPVLLGDGTTTNLRWLSAERPQLLLYVSENCGGCQDVIAAVPRWRAELPPLDIRLVLRSKPQDTTLASSAEPFSVHDTEGLLSETFDMRGTPSALLLGADGLLAGGPIVGGLAVPDFVDKIRTELGVTT